MNTFNPLFVNPALYSLAAVNTPANLTSLHPNLTLFPVERLMIYIDYSLFYRTSKQDGLYAPPRFLVRESSNTSSKKIGNVLGFKVKYEINHNLEFESTSSYFSPGGFIKETGDSESTFYFSSTVSFK
ncbi:MAG: alginate export family protein, partial [Bacteroidota bacterium]